MRKLARAIDALKAFMHHPLGRIEAAAGGLGKHHVTRRRVGGIVIGRQPLGLPRRFAGLFFADHFGHPQAVIREHFVASGFLRAMVRIMYAPGGQRGFVAPDLHREQRAFLLQIAEAVNEQTAASRFQLGFQGRGQGQVALRIAGLGRHFKEKGEHDEIVPMRWAGMWWRRGLVHTMPKFPAPLFDLTA